MAEPNEIIHQSLRLKIMAALTAACEPLEFSKLKALANATDGNLGAHLTTLEKAGYVTLEKDFVARKPRTRATLTRKGRKAFAAHVSYLREVLDQSG